MTSLIARSGSTITLVTLLRSWIRRFMMIIISAWWLPTNSKFCGKEFEKTRGTIGSLEVSKHRYGFFQTRSSYRNEKRADHPIVHVVRYSVTGG